MLTALILVALTAAAPSTLESSVCESEVARLCPSLKGDALTTCYARNVLDFKDPCRAAVMARTEELAKLCIPAQEAICPVELAQLTTCLSEHIEELPEPCREPLRKNLSALPGMRKELDARANAAFPCRPFIQKLCKELATELMPELAECFKPNEPRASQQCHPQRELAACLQSHRAQLSKRCRDDLKKWGGGDE